MSNDFFVELRDKAIQLSLDSWDWIAFSISIVAFVVAFLTLCSQRKTQKNTSPIITMDIQKKLWLFLIKQFYYKIQYIHILKTLLERCNYEKNPEESFIQSLCIAPENHLHEELFYGKKYDKYYGNVYWVKKHMQDYNLFLYSIANHLDQRNIKREDIERLFKKIDALCESLLKFYHLIYNEDTKSVYNTLKKELFDKQKKEREDTGEKLITELSDDELYSREDSFIQFFSEIEGFREEYILGTNLYIDYFMKHKSDRIVLEEG